MVAKYFSFVGYSGSGKTYAIELIIRYLVNKGYKVGICKSIHHPGFGIDIPDKDTTKYYENGAKILSYVSPEASGIIYIEKDQISQILGNIENKVDYLILEGFKELIAVPTIVFIKKYSDLEDFLNEYTIGVSSHLIDLSDHELFVKIENIPSLVEKMALPPMPGLNCKKCGYDSCLEFYRILIHGQEDVSKCVSRSKNVLLKVNDKLIPLNRFAGKMVQNITKAVVESLERPDDEISSIEIYIQNKLSQTPAFITFPNAKLPKSWSIEEVNEWISIAKKHHRNFINIGLALGIRASITAMALLEINKDEAELAEVWGVKCFGEAVEVLTGCKIIREKMIFHEVYEPPRAKINPTYKK